MVKPDLKVRTVTEKVTIFQRMCIFKLFLE